MHVSIFSKEFADQIKALSAGAFVIVLDGSSDTGASADSEQLSTGDPTTTCNVDPSGGVLAVVMWKCRGDSIDSLVAKVEIDGILSMLNAMKGTSLSSSSKELQPNLAHGGAFDVCLTLKLKGRTGCIVDASRNCLERHFRRRGA